jgi:hypothetical protein
LAAGDTRGAIEQLGQQGRIHEIPERSERFHAITAEYVRNPEGTLIVSPDNESRAAINGVIHAAMQDAGRVDRTEHHVRVLVARQDITGADRQWAQKYEAGDVVRYTKGSAGVGIEAGEYARVARVDSSQSLVTVSRDDGSGRTYDPRRLHGVTVYREAELKLAVGDRVQFTAPDRARQLANRELGAVERIDAASVHVRLDSGRDVTLSRSERLHLDHAYAVTSHSSQGQTADRVLVHVDTDGPERLVNRRLAYVAISRGRMDAQIYTNDASRLSTVIDRDVARRSATAHSTAPEHGQHQGPHSNGALRQAERTSEHLVR